jgi:hypothetical protein
MNKKTFFAILGLFAFLCILCSGLGILRTVLGESTQASIPSNLEEMLSQRLDTEDVDSAQPSKCREQLRQGAFVLAEGESCRLTIKSSSLPVRELPLQVTQGDQVRVVTDPNEENRLTAGQTLERGKHTKAQIFQEGGRIEIECLSGGSEGECKVEISQ